MAQFHLVYFHQVGEFKSGLYILWATNFVSNLFGLFYFCRSSSEGQPALNNIPSNQVLIDFSTFIADSSRLVCPVSTVNGRLLPSKLAENQKQLYFQEMRPCVTIDTFDLKIILTIFLYYSEGKTPRDHQYTFVLIFFFFQELLYNAPFFRSWIFYCILKMHSAIFSVFYDNQYQGLKNVHITLCT